MKIRISDVIKPAAFTGRGFYFSVFLHHTRHREADLSAVAIHKKINLLSCSGLESIVGENEAKTMFEPYGTELLPAKCAIGTSAAG